MDFIIQINGKSVLSTSMPINRIGEFFSNDLVLLFPNSCVTRKNLL